MSQVTNLLICHLQFYVYMYKVVHTQITIHAYRYKHTFLNNMCYNTHMYTHTTIYKIIYELVTLLTSSRFYSEILYEPNNSQPEATKNRNGE